MYNHAPTDYCCPFCAIVNHCARGMEARLAHGVVYADDRVTVLVPSHHYAGIRGNVLVIPTAHYENIFDLDPTLGVDLMRATRHVALVMKAVYHCQGISTRQHNEPAGNQDVWHYHQHVFPRFDDDHLYRGPKALYEPEERQHHAGLLREGWGRIS